jgi:hypothetical protein
MELTEIYADERGETHFRKSAVDLGRRDYAPPSQPVHVSPEMTLTVGNFLVAPPGWDKDSHPTPRRQFAILLSGRATITASDGDTIAMRPGEVILLNDQASRGHLTTVQEPEDATFLLVGIADETPASS